MLYLSENIRYLRAKAGKSQRALAEQLGITRARYSKYEYGTAEPPLEILLKISDYYHVTINVLIASSICDRTTTAHHHSK
ncbi:MULTISPECIES: helix-turn-helix domain-containing protein [Sphingobacterium]|uniref:Helix-turn-helix domain-containing protein n=1 Tax=Sphingobacterium populi TaxID=1812824 RepID=A0ABW5UF58_9SPHI|nr:helix-turn-helix transcriptional regulator [Sphingobacterium sp. CFCC 11742]